MSLKTVVDSAGIGWISDDAGKHLFSCSLEGTEFRCSCLAVPKYGGLGFVTDTGMMVMARKLLPSRFVRPDGSADLIGLQAAFREAVIRAHTDAEEVKT